MRVLIDGRVLSDRPTGLGRYAENLIASYVRTYGAHNVQVLVHPSFTKRLAGITYIDTSLSAVNLLHVLFLPFVLKKFAFDLFHASFYSGVPFKKRGAFYAVTVHDVIYRRVNRYFYKNWFLNFLAVTYFDCLVWLSLRPADYIISVSKTTADDLRNGFGKESVIIPEGFNTITSSLSPADVDTFFNNQGLLKGEYFLYVGNLKLHKGLEFLVDAYVRSTTKKNLLICGYYKHVPEYLKKDNRIKFTGFVDDELLPHIYANSAAFIFPSQYEGFGFPVLEALDYGCKVLSTTGGSLKEFPDKFIYFFEPGDTEALVTLLDTCDSLPPKEKNISALKQYYNWDRAMDQMQRMIKTEFQKHAG